MSRCGKIKRIDILLEIVKKRFLAIKLFLLIFINFYIIFVYFKKRGNKMKI